MARARRRVDRRRRADRRLQPAPHGGVPTDGRPTPRRGERDPLHPAPGRASAKGDRLRARPAADPGRGTPALGAGGDPPLSQRGGGMMPLVRLVLNIIWLVFGGFWLAIGYGIAA